MSQAPTNAPRRGHQITLCMLQCSKLKDPEMRNRCYENCMQTYLQDVFAAISEAAEDIGMPSSTFFDLLKRQFDVQYETTKKSASVEIAGAASC